MCHHDKNHAGAFIVGSLIGAAAGATAMFFLAPRSGKASRKMVTHRLEEIKDYAHDTAEEINNRVEDIFGEVNDITKSLYNDARKLWSKQVKSLSGAIDKIDKEKYTDMIDAVMESLKSNKKYTTEELSKVKRYLNTEVRKLVSAS